MVIIEFEDGRIDTQRKCTLHQHQALKLSTFRVPVTLSEALASRCPGVSLARSPSSARARQLKGLSVPR